MGQITRSRGFMTEVELAAKSFLKIYELGVLGAFTVLCLLALSWFARMFRRDFEHMQEEHRQERKEWLAVATQQATEYKRSIETIFADNKDSMASLNFGIESLRDRMSTNCHRFNQ